MTTKHVTDPPSTWEFSCPFTLPCQWTPKRILTITLVAVAVIALLGLLFLTLWLTGGLLLMIAHPFITLSCIFGTLSAIAIFGLILGVCNLSPTPKPSAPSPPKAEMSDIPNSSFEGLLEKLFKKASQYPPPIDPQTLFDRKNLPDVLSCGTTLQGSRWISLKGPLGTAYEELFLFVERGDPPRWKMANRSEKTEIDLTDEAKRLIEGLAKDLLESKEDVEESSEDSTLEA